jgi:hypothetical protein
VPNLLALHMGEWRYSSTILDLGTRWRDWSASRPDRFIPGKISRCTYWIGGSVGPRAGLNSVKNRPYHESNTGPPARSPSLYRLSYSILSWRRHSEILNSPL